MQNVSNRENCVGRRGKRMHESSVLSAQFCSVKLKLLKNNKAYKSKISYIQDPYDRKQGKYNCKYQKKWDFKTQDIFRE